MSRQRTMLGKTLEVFADIVNGDHEFTSKVLADGIR